MVVVGGSPVVVVGGKLVVVVGGNLVVVVGGNSVVVVGGNPVVEVGGKSVVVGGGVLVEDVDVAVVPFVAGSQGGFGVVLSVPVLQLLKLWLQVCRS